MKGARLSILVKRCILRAFAHGEKGMVDDDVFRDAYSTYIELIVSPQEDGLKYFGLEAR
jgi:hypothetical protein